MNASTTAWVVVADSSKACILSPGRNGQRPQLLRELSHPSGREKPGDIRADRPGRTGRSGGRRAAGPSGGGVMDGATAAKDVEARKFARQLADELKRASDARLFDTLAVVAPPHFLGILRGELAPDVARRVEATADKDLTHIRPHDLPPHLEDLFGGNT